MNPTPAVFLDRDGTLIEERHFLYRPEDVVLLPGAGAALRRLADAGFKLVLVSNQSGVGRGYFTLADVERVHARLGQDLAEEGVRLERITLRRRRRVSPAGAASRRRSTYLTLATNSALILPAVTWSATS